MKKHMRRLGVSALLIALGGWIAFQATVHLVNGLRSRGWETVDGEVTVSRVNTQRKLGSGPWRNRSELEIVYRYTVDGREYESNRVSFHDVHSEDSSSGAAAGHVDIKERYPVGRRVEVHYDPGDPELAVLETGISFYNGFGLLFGVVFLAAGGLIASGLPGSD